MLVEDFRICEEVPGGAVARPRTCTAAAMQGLQQAQQQLEAYAPPPGTTMPLGAACAMGAAGLGLVRSFFPAPRLSASAVGARRVFQGFVRRAS